MASKLKSILWSQQPKPQLQEGEAIIREGVAVLTKGLGGVSRGGHLILTNRRLLWYESAAARPLRPLHGEVNLSDIASVDKGTFYDVIFGGTPVRLRLRNGKDKCLWEGDGKLDEWVAAIGAAVTEARLGGAP